MTVKWLPVRNTIIFSVTSHEISCELQTTATILSKVYKYPAMHRLLLTLVHILSQEWFIMFGRLCHVVINFLVQQESIYSWSVPSRVHGWLCPLFHYTLPNTFLRPGDRPNQWVEMLNFTVHLLILIKSHTSQGCITVTQLFYVLENNWWSWPMSIISASYQWGALGGMVDELPNQVQACRLVCTCTFPGI